MATKNVTIGLILLAIVIGSSVLITFNDKAQIKVTKTSSTFYIKVNGVWLTSGVETSKLYNGTKLLSPNSTLSKVDTVYGDKDITITRTSIYNSGQQLIDTYSFDGNINDVEKFPINHTVTAINAKGLTFQYQVSNLVYNGGTIDNVKSPQRFGRNMIIEWQNGSSSSTLKKISSGGQLTVKYPVNSTTEDFMVRLFDPVTLNIDYVAPTPANNSNISTDYLNIIANITATNLKNVTAQLNGNNIVMYDDSLVQWYGFDNISAFSGNGTIEYDLTGRGYNGSIRNSLTFVPGTGYAGSGSLNFSENDSVGQARYVLITSHPVNRSTVNWTASVWVKPYDYSYADSPWIFSVAGSYQGELRWTSSSQRCWGMLNNGSDNVLNAPVGSCPTGQWTLFTEKKEGDNYSVYINGVYKASKIIINVNTSAYGSSSDAQNIGANTGFANLNYLSFNGSLDDLKVWNRSLSEDEIAYQYYGFLERYGVSNYPFIINSTIPSYNASYLYNITIFDTSGNTNSTDTRVINKLQTYKLLEFNFSKLIGAIRPNFYGANTHNYNPLITDSNSSWMSQYWLSAKMGYQRVDMNMGLLYGGLFNLDLETLGSNTTVLNISGNSSRRDKLFLGWNIGVNTGANGNASVVTDSESGTYAQQVNGSESATGALYVVKQDDNGNALPLALGSVYNWTVWLKGNGTFLIGFQDRDTFSHSVGGSFKSVTVNGTYQQFTGGGNVTYASSNGYRFVIDDIRANETITIDNLNITQNGNPMPTWWNSSPSVITNWQSLLNWSNYNNQKVLFISSYMPNFLADVTNNCYNSSNSSFADTSDCPPTNYTIWGLMNKDFLDRITNNGAVYRNVTEIEVWNEPYGINSGGSWMDMTNNETQKVNEFAKLYNYTWHYDKTTYPDIPVGGTTLYYGDSNGRDFSNLFLQYVGTNTGTGDNVSSDFMSIHDYNDPIYSSLNQHIGWVFGNMSLYGVNNSRLIVSEWNVGSASEKDTPDQYPQFENDIAMGYANSLNTYPANITMVIYQWWAAQKYDATQAEYPQKWQMVSPPKYDNELNSNYNATNKFGNYCPTGWATYNSTSADPLITTVACYNGTVYTQMIINQDSVNKSVNISSNVPLINIYTLESYSPQNGRILIPNISATSVNVLSSSFYRDLLNGTNIIQDYLGNNLTSQTATISLSSGISRFHFTPVNSTQQGLDADNQTNSLGVLNISNVGLGNINNISIKLSATQTGWALQCSNSSSSGWINLTTSYQQIYYGLNPGSSQMIWCRANLNNPSSQWNGRIYVDFS